MNKIFIVFALFLINFKASACPIKNHIFLIHGISGSVATFGSLEKYLNKIDECNVTTSFAYDTGNSSLSTYDFTIRFHEFVMDKIITGNLSATDKISLIMHSQGGIIGNIWMNKIKQNDIRLFAQIDSFITLSTPHWGADMANLGSYIFYSLPPGIGNPLSPFGRIELNEMSYGSDTIRELLWSYDNLFSQKHFRPLALAGNKEGINHNVESDVVVPIYSARADHYKGESNVELSVSEGSIALQTFTKTMSIPLVVVPATHIKMDLPGIASIPKTCLTEKKCDHPSISAITNHLQGRSVASILPELKNFRLSLYVNNYSHLKLEKHDVKIELLKTHNVSISTLPAFYHGKAQLERGFAFSLEGSTSKTGMQTVVLLLKIKNQIVRKIEIPAEGGFTSFLNMNLVN